VPYGFDGAATGTIQVGAPRELVFEIVRHVAKEESPLVQLVSSRRSSRPSPTSPSTVANQVGNDISVNRVDPDRLR